MAKLPAMQNQYVEFAKNDSEGNELSKVNTLASIPVLTEDNAAEIFQKKPKTLVYNNIVYNLQDIGEYPYGLYYSSIFDNEVLMVSLAYDGDEVTINYNVLSLAAPSDIKPIYCHPIRLSLTDSGATTYIRLTCLIFNNDSSPINTLDKFKKYLDDLNTATQAAGTIMTSGGYTLGTKTIIASYLYKNSANDYYVVGINASDGLNEGIGDNNFNVLFPASTTIVDGVNRIN